MIYVHDELVLSRPIQNRVLFEAGGPGARVTGLRLRGPDAEIHGATAVYDTHEGITLTHDDCVSTTASSGAPAAGRWA